jgi:hypothetical protein
VGNYEVKVMLDIRLEKGSKKFLVESTRSNVDIFRG